MTRIRPAIVLAAALLLALAPAAAAGNKHGSKPHKQGPPAEATATATATVSGNGSIATATATCPRRMRAVSGGFEAPSSVEVLGLVFESVKTGPRSWRASAQLLEVGATSGLTLKTTANCRRKLKSGRTRRVTAPTDGSPHLGPLVSASCRRNQVAVAGGFTMPAPLAGQMVTGLVLDSRRDGATAWSTWLATGAGGPSSAATEVYCARGLGGISDQMATSPASSTFFEQVSATAECPSGQRPLSGGFTQPLSDVTSFLFIVESQRVDGGWRVSGLHSGSSPEVTLSALAYCS